MPKPHFILLPGFSPDADSMIPLKKHLEESGYTATISNFWGDQNVSDFSELTFNDCMAGIDSLIKTACAEHKSVAGLGVSIGGALLMEYAKENPGLDFIISVGTPFRLRNRKWISLGIYLLPAFYPVWKLFQKIKKLRLLPIGAAPMVLDYVENWFLADYENIKIPVFFIHSKQDFVADYKAVAEFSKYFKNSLLPSKILDNGNHVFNYDPETIIENSLEFLNGLQNKI